MVSVASPSTESFVSLVEKDAAAADIAAPLDGLTPAHRIAEVQAMGGALQAKLWTIAKGKGALDLANWVQGTDKINIYEGKNSLVAFTHFQKRFWRAPSGDVVGYNHNDALV